MLPILLLLLFAVSSNCRIYNESLARRLLDLTAASYGMNIGGCLDSAFSWRERRYIYASTQRSCDRTGSACHSFIVVSNVTKEAIFVFRGTNTKKQLLLEGWSMQHDGKDFFGMGKVNSYFRKAHKELWPYIHEFLSRPEFKHYKVILTGHSLGGALASLAAARIVKEGLRSGPSLTLYTFGQPRTGSYNFAKAFDAMRIPCFRIVFRTDIVPHLPACVKDPSYPKDAHAQPCWADASNDAYHHGTEIWYPESMAPGSEYVVCTGTPKNEDMGCSDHIVFTMEYVDGYVWMHRHYFDVKVTTYGKSGCRNTTVEPYVQQSKVGLVGLLGKAHDTWRNIFAKS